MWNYIVVLIISALVTFYVHDVLDRKFFGRDKRNLKLIIKGYHIHHSFFGALVIILALVFTTGGYVAFICYGYGVGNIWQHKLVHNRAHGKGMVFITKLNQNKRILAKKLAGK